MRRAVFGWVFIAACGSSEGLAPAPLVSDVQFCKQLVACEGGADAQREHCTAYAAYLRGRAELRGCLAEFEAVRSCAWSKALCSTPRFEPGLSGCDEATWQLCEELADAPHVDVSTSWPEVTAACETSCSCLHCDELQARECLVKHNFVVAKAQAYGCANEVEAQLDCLARDACEGDDYDIDACKAESVALNGCYQAAMALEGLYEAFQSP